ncbi:MAG: hypothetical protein M3Z25_17060 [Actinomycetota bacterium]|nr:hypothetical protein [Actinomycetota bacterium]
MTAPGASPVTDSTPGRPRVRCVLGMLGTDVHSKGIRTLVPRQISRERAPSG